MFCVEVDGPALSVRSPVYGAGEAFFRARADRAVDKRYAFPSIGAVVDGEFGYAARGGRVTAGRGAVIFGSVADDFRVWMHGSRKVHRSVIAVDPTLVAEVAADCGLDSERFPAELLPPSRASLPMYGLIRRIAASTTDQTESVIQLLGAAYTTRARRSDIDHRARPRVSKILRDLQHRYAEEITLEQMAEAASLSRYHFIRVFQSLTGETPRQHLIGIRLRAAADRLIESREPITGVALQVGFNDVSHFNSAFRQAFRMSPREWRHTSAVRMRQI